MRFIPLKQFSAIAMALALAGCVTVGPNVDAPIVNQVSLEKGLEYASFQSLNSQWWAQFNDPHLSALITLADRNNPSLAIAAANIDRALAIFDDSQDNALPAGTVDATYQAQRQVFLGGPQMSERVSMRTRELGINAGWQLDLVGKFKRAEQVANADAQAAMFAWQEARLTLLSNIATSYIEFRGLQQRINVAQNTLISLQRTQQVVLHQFESGFATQLDTLRIDGQVAAVEAQIPPLAAALERNKQTLIALSGGEAKTTELNWQTAPLPTFSAPLPLQNSADFLQYRPDVQAAQQSVIAATAGIGVAQADLYPSLSLNGFLGFFSTNGAVLDGNAKAWSIAPSLSWQLFDLDSVRARVRLADAEQLAVIARYEQTVLNAVAQTKTALSDYTQTQNQLHALQRQLDSNEKALALARYQYANGAIDLLNLLDVERQFLATRDQWVRAQTQLSSSLVAVYTALGGGILAT